MSSDPTFPQIRAQISALQAKLGPISAVGIRTQGIWRGDERIVEQDRTYRISYCVSPLAMREALREPADERTTKVLLTPLDDQELSEDIRLRLAKRRLFRIDPWHVVRSLFGAGSVDPRLVRSAWIADALIEADRTVGLPRIPGDFLDAETAWRVLLASLVDFNEATCDLTSLVRWSGSDERVARFRALPIAVRDGVVAWWRAAAGEAAAPLLDYLVQAPRPDAISVGLIAGMLFAADTPDELKQIAGRFEGRILGATVGSPESLQRWAVAATELVRSLRTTDRDRWRSIPERAERLLREIHAESWAHRSNLLPIGFEQRMGEFGRALGGWVAAQSWRGSSDPTRSLIDAVERIMRHDHATWECVRIAKVQMAMRLVRWLIASERDPLASPETLAAAADRHRSEGGWVDWARTMLCEGDQAADLSSAYHKLYRVVTERREADARQFAERLVERTAENAPLDDPIPVERFLERIVAPLAKHAGGVLLVVLDGMSMAIWRELSESLRDSAWRSLVEAGRDANRTVLATIPSKTECSRTSLLTGRLTVGDSAVEKTGFEQHPALLAACTSGAPPRLFHKSELSDSDDAVLSRDLRAAIGAKRSKVIGFVVNAIDDQLQKGEQLVIRWNQHAVKVLPALLQEARQAERVVVIVADHGHVLEQASELRSFEGGERWRVAGEVGPFDDELLVSGERVLEGNGRIIAPWSERVRYAPKRKGYHGGLSPQEMLVPFAVLTASEEPLEGWNELGNEKPNWWYESPEDLPSRPMIAVPKSAAAPPPKELLFDKQADEVPTVNPAIVEAIPEPEWLRPLLTSPLFAAQQKLAGRVSLNEAQLVRVLSILDRRQGRMTIPALAKAWGQSELRLGGLIASLGRLLNVDGYPVIERDEASKSVHLDIPLLRKQFQL